MGKYDSRIFAAGGLGSVSGVVSTFPAGAVLGEERWENGVKYKLFYNAGNSTIDKGYCFSPVTLANTSTPFSVTVSTATNQGDGFVGGLCIHATATTGTYFWGAVKGLVTASLLQSGSTLVTGDMFSPGLNGAMNGISAASATLSGNVALGYVVAGPTAGTTAVAATVTVMLTRD